MDDVRTAGSAVEDGDLLHVKLPEFDGPLDLLLHLVRKHELEIHDLRLADLTEPYLAYLERIHSRPSFKALIEEEKAAFSGQ